MTFSVETCSITTLIRLFSRPFPSYLVLLVQNGSSCKTFHTETSLIYIKMNLHVGETRLHMNGASRELVLTQRQKPTRKWPICGAFSLVFKFTRKVKYLNLKKLMGRIGLLRISGRRLSRKCVCVCRQPSHLLSRVYTKKCCSSWLRLKLTHAVCPSLLQVQSPGQRRRRWKQQHKGNSI